MKSLFRAKFLTFPTTKAAYALKRPDRVKLLALAVTQIFLGVLDLIGVVVIGALGALSVQGLESQKVGNKVGTFLRILNLQNLNFQSQIAFLGLAGAFVLIFKTSLIRCIATKNG
jgi:ATP-binding cassette subfamily C protein